MPSDYCYYFTTTTSLWGGCFYLTSRGGTLIGGTSAGAGNLISGNTNLGINIVSSQNNIIKGNKIGTDAAGTAAPGNGTDGIKIQISGIYNTIIGGSEPGAPNIIAFNGHNGITNWLSTGNAFQGNQIFSNGGLGIDLKEDGVASNDLGDPDTGGNNRQNYPVLTSSVSDGSVTAVQGTLNSTADTIFYIEFFSNTTCDPTGYGEGETHLGYTSLQLFAPHMTAAKAIQMMSINT